MPPFSDNPQSSTSSNKKMILDVNEYHALKKKMEKWPNETDENYAKRLKFTFNVEELEAIHSYEKNNDLLFYTRDSVN